MSRFYKTNKEFSQIKINLFCRVIFNVLSIIFIILADLEYFSRLLTIISFTVILMIEEYFDANLDLNIDGITIRNS